MEIKEIFSQLNNELKKEVPEKNLLVSNFNLLIKTYNDMISSLKEKEGEGVDELKNEINQSEKKYKKKVIDLNTIFEIAKELSSSLYVDDLMKIIILTSMGHMLSETGVVFIFDEELQKYMFRNAKGIKEDLKDIEFSIDEELIKYINEKSEPIGSKEILAESFYSEYKEKFKRLNCELIVPIKIKNKFNGILFLGPKAGGMPFTESNLEFMVALGNFAAIAIENARLYEDIDKKMKDLSVLYDISKEINKSVDLDVAVNLMLETITTGFGSKKCSIILYDELKKMYRIIKNFNISEEQSKSYLDIMLQNKIKNPLDSQEPDVIFDNTVFSNGDVYFSVPLIAGNKKVGLLNIYQFSKEIVVNEDIKKIFSIIASQMAPPLVLTQYLSKRDTYRENPFDYIYNMLLNIIEKSKETGTGFVIMRIKFFAEDITFVKMKNFIEKIKNILQETDILIHSNFDELVIIFPASQQDEVKSLMDNFVPSLTGINMKYIIKSYPQDGDNIITLLKKLFKPIEDF